MWSSGDCETNPEEEGFVCIQCMSPSPSLYHQYSKEVIRLTQCKECGAIVDKYVEYDTTLIVIDLIMHYTTAYRHILYNMKIDKFARLALIFVTCDAYEKWIEGRANQANIYDLEWIFYRSLLRSGIEMTTMVAVSGVAFEWTTRKSFKRTMFVVRSTIISYYGNVAVLLAIIFRLSGEPSYRSVITLFLCVSHLQVQRGLLLTCDYSALHPDLHWIYSVLWIGVGMFASSTVGQLAATFIR